MSMTKPIAPQPPKTILFGGLYYPETETHIPEWLEREGAKPWEGHLVYQERKQRAAYEICARLGRTELAVDVGAHVGTWAVNMARVFRHVECFEPEPRAMACLEANMLGAARFDGSVTLHQTALGATGCPPTLRLARDPANTGATTARRNLDELTDTPPDRFNLFEFVDVPCMTLDRVLDADAPVSFLKIDVEGLELDVIRGASSTLDHAKPIVLIEQKFPRDDPPARFSATRYLENVHGYSVVTDLGGGDMVLVHSTDLPKLPR